MKKIIAASLFAVAAAFTFTAPANAGSCDYSWQTANDGSNCGGRAADQRWGGR